ncbi:DUF6318 family protein [Arthrobacter sp. 754]|uniref:DUF6318 family protein n=1 Tax=Arthrobacter sp. 754 TaxID=3156315 RepID=UPI003392407F
MTSHKLTSSWRIRGVSVALVVAAAAALSGCNSGGDPGPAATATSSAVESISPRATPTPTATYKPADATGRAQNVPLPVLPEVARTETKEGLEAFARYWYATLTYAYETGDIKPLESISGPDCGSCGRVKEVVEGWHSDGRWLVGGRMVVEGAQTKFVEVTPGEYQVLIQVRQDPVSYYRADKTLDETSKSGPAIGDIMISTFENGQWKAKTVEHLVNEK